MLFSRQQVCVLQHFNFFCINSVFKTQNKLFQVFTEFIIERLLHSSATCANSVWSVHNNLDSISHGIFKKRVIHVSHYTDVHCWIMQYNLSKPSIFWLLTLMIIAVDLLIKLKKPLHYNTIVTPRRANIVICCIWLVPISVFGIVFAIKEFYLFTYVSVQQYGSIGSVIFFIVIYNIIFCQIRKRKNPSASRQSIATTKAAVTMLIIVTVYILCMMPMNWTMILIVYTQVVELSPRNMFTLGYILQFLYVFNTIADPIVFGVRIPEIRQQYAKLYWTIFPRRRCRIQQPTSSTSNDTAQTVSATLWWIKSK